MADQDVFYVFYNQIPNSTFIFPDGTQANFTGGRYATKDKIKAAHLTEVVAQGNQHIYIKPEQMTATEEELDPMAEYKARVIADYLAKQAASGQSDMGTSEQGKLNVVDSAMNAELSTGEAATPKVSVKIPSAGK